MLSTRDSGRPWISGERMEYLGHWAMALYRYWVEWPMPPQMTRVCARLGRSRRAEKTVSAQCKIADPQRTRQSVGGACERSRTCS